MKKLSFILLLYLQVCTAVTPKIKKEYRHDYEYNSDRDAFYKLHVETYRKDKADDICKVEGAKLMNPASPHDIEQLHHMMKMYRDNSDVNYVWVENDGRYHEESVEEIAVLDAPDRDSDTYTKGCEAVDRDGDILNYNCYYKLPFICKVAAKDAVYDSACGVFGAGYKYYPSVGSCYKVPRIALKWDHAYTECISEGAHLVIINSEAEARVVHEVMERNRLVTVTDWYFFFAGFRVMENAKPNVFKTIFNQTLEEAGYSSWQDNEPNNHNGNELCGSLNARDAKLNDIDCARRRAFICEKEVTK